MFKDRRFLYLMSGVTVAVLILFFSLDLVSTQRKELAGLREQHREMLLLKAEFLDLSKRIRAVESRKGLAKVEGVAQAVDEIFVPLGLKDRVTSVKTTGTKETKDGFEEGADIFVEKVSMNEMVNIFYRIDHAPMVLTVRKANVKKSFDTPDLLNISLGLSLFRPK
jgi:hypothetical protein